MQRSVWYLEDDASIAESVKESLESQGFLARIFSDGITIRNALTRETPSVLLLDWNLPEDSGPSICRWIRQRDAELPIMMITVRDEPAEIVEGLHSGADDYVTKPFVMDVLLSRIEALLRRTAPTSPVFTCGDLLLNTETGSAYLQEQALELSPLEYRLLELFMRNKGRIVSRETIHDAIWQTSGSEASDNTLTVAIKRLRAKLGPSNHLKTVRSFGYRMEEPL